MVNLRKSLVIFVIVASMALFQVSATAEKFSESKESSESSESSERLDMDQGDGEIKPRSLLGDTKVNHFADPMASSGDSEPVSFQSDEFIHHEEYETDAGTDDSERHSEMGNSNQGGNETDRMNSSAKATAKFNASVPDVDVAPTPTLIPVGLNKSEVVVSDKSTNTKAETNNSDASIPVVDDAPALGLIPIEPNEPDVVFSEENISDEVETDNSDSSILVVDVAPAIPVQSTKPEEDRDKQLLDAQVIPGQQNSKDDGIPEAPELEVIPHGNNPEFEKTLDQEISDDMNKLESELKSFVNPRYASIARNHRVLLTAIIIGFFALAIATVMFTFYRGFKIFSLVIRRHTGGNYRRMEEEVDNDFVHSHVFQQKP